MLAVLATLGLFVVWSAVGLAALVALRADLTELRVALTAPILGTALTVIPLFVVSNAGVSMHAGAPPVLIVLLVAGIIVLAIRRPHLSLTVVPVVVLCLLELVLVGRPMFRFGFDWLANANGDMAYYVLSATHLMSHGLQSAIDFNALADNRGLFERGSGAQPERAPAGIADHAGRSGLEHRPPACRSLHADVDRDRHEHHLCDRCAGDAGGAPVVVRDPCRRIARRVAPGGVRHPAAAAATRLGARPGSRPVRVAHAPRAAREPPPAPFRRDRDQHPHRRAVHRGV